MAAPKKNTTWKKTALIILCVLLALILAVLLTFTIWFESLLGRIKDPSTLETYSDEQIESYLKETDSMDDFTGEIIDPDDVTMPSGTVDLIDGEEIINVLLIGQDRRSSAGIGNTDAMILCTVNIKEKTLTMTSFLRDLWVSIPGYYNERLNTAYFLGKGSFDLLNETLKANFGVVVDHNVEVDFTAFEKVVNLLGGIELELTSKEAAYLNRRGNWDVDDSTAGKWQLKAGMNLLTGEQALAFSRIRNIDADGDFSRTGRQRKVLNKMVEEAKKMNLLTMIAMAEEIIPLLTTDMTDSEIIGYIRALAPMLSELKVINQRVPADGTYKLVMINRKSVIQVDFEKNRELLKQAIGDS